jgi:cytochrome c
MKAGLAAAAGAGLLAACTLAAAEAPAPGDAARGLQVYQSRCGACHSVDADRTGPHHAGVIGRSAGVIGRRAGSVPGFACSPALKASGIVWDPQTLDRWLADPQALVPGQDMGYSLADGAKRADVIAYLATLKPAP